MINKVKYQCLVCEHAGVITSHDKEDYQEVRVCPECNGAFVDVWKIAKYPNKIKSNGVVVVDDSMNLIPIRPTINITVNSPNQVSEVVTKRFVESIKNALKGL